MRYQNRKKREVTQLALDKVENAIELRGITKTFGSVVANDHIDLDVRRGEILALLGENGSGKTTLMNMISGIYHPDEGSIHVNGREVVINSPMDAKRLGIGMIHQHFKLVDVFSAMDNVVIGAEGKRIKPKELKEKILELTKKFGLEVEPEKKIYNMSVSEKQTVEILNVLYRNSEGTVQKCGYFNLRRAYSSAHAPGDPEAFCHSAQNERAGKRYYHYHPQAE